MHSIITRKTSSNYTTRRAAAFLHDSGRSGQNLVPMSSREL
ncbi:hypothetical protein LINGRAHAP2_LOCUS29130 [Linum grandiflorum]